MVYIYNCKCGHEFEIIKSVKDIDNVEPCPKCDAKDTFRIICCQNGFYGEKDWDKAEYNPGLGRVIKGTRHREKVAKEMGLIEVGNEDFSRVTATNEKDRNQKLDANFEKSFEETAHHLNNALRTG